MIQLNPKEMQKYTNELAKYKVKCKCGHPRIVLPEHINPKGYEICDWCGKRVYRDKEREKRDRFKEEMRRKLNV